jgi:hypothetical protein
VNRIVDLLERFQFIDSPRVHARSTNYRFMSAKAPTGLTSVIMVLRLLNHARDPAMIVSKASLSPITSS